jgi:hypothetical protein
VLFIVTVLALVATLFADPEAPVNVWLNTHGTTLLLAEVAAIAVLGMAAMGRDQWLQKREDFRSQLPQTVQITLPDPAAADAPIVQLARLLFRGDERLVAEFQQALTDPVEFVQQHGASIGSGRHKPDWAPEPWNLLIDFAQVKQWVWVIDWKEGPTDVVAGLQDITPTRELQIEWNALAIEHEEMPTADFLAVLAAAIRPSGSELVSLNAGNDSYELTLIKEDQIAEVCRLARKVTYGQIIQF